MWIAKIKFSSTNTLLGENSSKNKVDLFVLPIGFFHDKKGVISHIAGTIFGEEKNRKGFLKDMKKEKRVINFELNNDFFVGTIKEPGYMKEAYDKDMIMVMPLFVSQEGHEIATIGSFKKELLSKIADVMEKRYNGKLLSIQNKKIKSISITKIQPEITERQREAIHLAMKNGYYHSPRKIDIKSLAKKANLSFSTFQVHLRKAEEKLIPYFFE